MKLFQSYHVYHNESILMNNLKKNYIRIIKNYKMKNLLFFFEIFPYFNF